MRPGLAPVIERSDMSEFEGVVPALAAALSARGYQELTPVQKAVLSSEIGQADALVSARTGSGKTVAFGLALAPDLLQGAAQFARAQAPLALVIAPTRELALQVRRELEWLYGGTKAWIASCVGGMDMRAERRALERGAHIVVGTPGRLRDHIERGSLDLGDLKAVVLDEADEMLDLGFREELEFILGAAPRQRRTLMFSATVSRSIATLAERYQHKALRVTTTDAREQHLDIAYRALNIVPKDQENAIINVLRYYDASNAIVFCGTRATVNHMSARLNNRGFSVVALSGELSQNERSHALQAMRDGRANVCVATDVAARGIDLPNLELVIHADLPKNKESLLHRSGRTGRAGRKGVSALIVPKSATRRTERLLQSAGITAAWDVPPGAEAIIARDDARLLADPALADDIRDSEADLVASLLAQHDPERIAAALVRKYRAGKSAPEELLDVGPPQERGAARDDFTDGVWFEISVGRQDNAEPRWLLPMVIRGGNINKKDVGAIRIQDKVSYVELAPGAVARFVKSLGQSEELEEGITARMLEKPPVFSSAPRGRARPHPREKQARQERNSARSRAHRRGQGAKPEQQPPKTGSDGPDNTRRKKPKADKKPFDHKAKGTEDNKGKHRKPKKPGNPKKRS